MKIALFSWETLHSIRVGGVAVHVTELAAALERKGHEVHVFTRMGRNQSQYDKIHGVHYHRCPFQLSSNFVDEVNNMCRSFVHHFFETEHHIGRFDIIHAHDWLSSNAMVWIKEARGRKSIFTVHSTEYGRSGNKFWGGQSARVRDHERHGTYCADKVITVSNALKSEVIWMYNLPDWKVRTIYNGIIASKYNGTHNIGDLRRKYNVGPMDPTILFSGRMVHQKGPDILLAAIPYILRYYSHAKFIFAGDGDLRPVLENMAGRMRISHATRFLGYADEWELINLYRCCDALCVPSRNEPFGIIILEAWSAGKPVIASVNGGPNEFVSHNITGLKINPTPESVAWGIGTLFTNFEWARWMGNNGKIAAETDFSWDKIADQVMSVYAG